MWAKRAALVVFIAAFAGLASAALPGGVPDVWPVRVGLVAALLVGAAGNQGAEW